MPNTGAYWVALGENDEHLLIGNTDGNFFGIKHTVRNLIQCGIRAYRSDMQKKIDIQSGDRMVALQPINCSSGEEIIGNFSRVSVPELRSIMTRIIASIKWLHISWKDCSHRSYYKLYVCRNNHFCIKG